MDDRQGTATERADAPSVGRIFLAFTKISLTSFGGGLNGWMRREFVHNRHWMSEDEFLTGLALAQAFPGVNVVNLSIWVGFRLRGGAGATVAALGMIVPAMFVALALLAVFDRLMRFPAAPVILAGVAAAAVGLSLEMGIRAARGAATSVVRIVIMAATFLAIFAFRLPLLPVAAPISIAFAFRHPQRDA